MTDEPTLKPVIWVGSSRKDIREFPEPVQDHAELVFKIDAIMKQRRLKQAEAADLLGIKQPDVSRMLRGDFESVSPVNACSASS